MNISYFNNLPFVEALDKFFEELQVPVSKIAQAPGEPEDLIPENYKPENPAHMLINNIYFLGMVNEHAFENTEDHETLDTVKEYKEDYDGLLIFGIELHARENELLPTRSQLAEICRAFNREYNYTPVTIIFQYGNLLAFANSERLKYKQEWREGEKVGKISLLRDIDIERPHSGHLRILRELQIPKTGKNAVNTFEKLYKYWQEVFSVSLLNKKFYKELSNWYFWAIKHVVFPNRPTAAMAHEKGIELDELIREHNATNVIRLLTRILFVWFIKEKKLIPEELFDLDTLQEDILKEISPYHETDGIFATANKESVYYKAILQNLFFASLNCPIKADDVDARTRGFRLKNHYGQDRGNDWRYRYENYFKNPDAFLEMINKTVPFLNGGLFECLDEKLNNVYIDGFSDQMTKGELLVVPDYLFFGTETYDDISEVTGIKNKENKNADVKGLINILKSYKFTITENTPIEEDIELDPELLGKVFENLLASYNPETKTTARKQTGSFYTPREIVNYMVDESLIAYLKNKFDDNYPEEDLDVDLHKLISYTQENPFDKNKAITEKLIQSLDECKILDPACGSGAFPMGVLQKMVHILQKLDPDNELWYELQLQKAMDETRTAYQIQDKKEREKQIVEINESFDRNINDPDYARKLYLIENCIYGVDIQPIAIQISKLRFFISLVSDQKTNSKLDNFGIKPLPNLETRFVAANTLIGIEKPKEMASLFENQELKKLENELKQIRHKLFSARTKDTKLKYRQKDAELREKLSDLLKENGWPLDTAEKLAGWDPYDQNLSSPFFDPEWMFDITDGFDVVIGNPPYIGEKGNKNIFKTVKQTAFGTKHHLGRMDYFYFFYHKSLDLTKRINGIITFITTNYFITAHGGLKLRHDLKERCNILSIVNFNELKIFESAAGQHNMICVLKTGNVSKCRTLITNTKKKGLADPLLLNKILERNDNGTKYFSVEKNDLFDGKENYIRLTGISNCNNDSLILNQLNQQGKLLKEICNVNNGLRSGIDRIRDENKGVFVLSTQEINRIYNSNIESIVKKYYKNSDITKYCTATETDKYIIYSSKNSKIDMFPLTKKHLLSVKDRIEEKRWKESVPWYSLVRARDKNIFVSEKIVSPQRSNSNTFGYSNSEWYAGSDVFFITKKDNCSLSIRYLLGLLNSKLFFFWLYHKGKRKGEMLELIGTPLKEIPVKVNPTNNFEVIITLITDFLILNLRKRNQIFQQILDAIIFELYFPDHMQEREIDVLQFVERDIEKAMRGREFENLSDTEKEQVIEQLHQTWTDPENEVVKRMGMFKEKSPDILGVIMEG